MGSHRLNPGSPLASAPIYPLKASANHRYLVDQNNVPFLIVGDSPHGLMSISPSQQETYLTSRQAAGINSLWVSALCSTYSGICPSFNAYDGTPPFTTPGDLATPNPTYFAHLDALLNLAAQHGMTVFLGPIETGGWLSVLTNNGTTKAYNYGVYLGTRYKNVPNLVWLHGNDFQTWQTASDDAVVQAVAKGIRSVDANHLQTVELDYPTSASLNDASWAPVIQLDTAYSYFSTYDQVLREYNRSSYLPVYFLEGVYEYQGYEGGYTGPHELRAQEYWTQLSGSAGHFYGNANLYGFPAGWPTSDWQTSPGIRQFGYWTNLFQSRPWYNLVPDQGHTVVTAGYGTYESITAGVIGNTSDYATTARTPDGQLVLAYVPTRRTITVAMSQLAGAVTARWYDPTNGTYSGVAGSPFANSGAQQFTPPGNNSSGEGDWVLVLEVNPTSTPIPTGTPVNAPTSTPTSQPTSTPTPAPTSTSTITMGEPTILNTADSGNGNLLVAQQVSLGQNATVQSMSFYVTTPSGHLRLGIYDSTGPNSSPGALKASTAEFIPVAGWNTVPVSSPTPLTAGTYWLAYLPESSSLGFRMDPSGNAVYYSYTYGALPATFSTSPTQGTYHWSFFATLTTTSAPTNTPTAAPTPCSTKPARPSLASPGNRSTATTSQVSLSWSRTKCTTHYQVMVRRGTTLGAVVDNPKNVADSSYTTVALTPGRTYYWRVRACDTVGCSAWTGYRSFKVSSTATMLDLFNPLGQDN